AYPAPGAPQLAQRVQTLLTQTGFATEINARRGLDHGAWVPLRLMYPEADIPVTQLSVQSSHNAAYHYRLGMMLKPLREQGVLIVGSGGFTHNLGEISFHTPNAPTPPYVEQFRHWMTERIEHGDTDALVMYRHLAPHATRAH